MSYCDNCILLDICGKEGCCDDAMTFCSDKHMFIHKSVIEDIKAEIDGYCSDNRDRNDGLYIAMKIIDKHMRGTENDD